MLKTSNSTIRFYCGILSIADRLKNRLIKCSYQCPTIPRESLINIKPFLDLTGTTEIEDGLKNRQKSHFQLCWIAASWTSAEMLDHHCVFMFLSVHCKFALCTMKDISTCCLFVRLGSRSDLCRECFVTSNWWIVALFSSNQSLCFCSFSLRIFTLVE